MMLKRKLMALAIASSICLTAIAKESEPSEKVTCEVALGACVDYVSTFDAERTAYQTVIRRQDDKIQELQKDTPVAWYWYALGGVVGGIALQGVMK